MNNRATNNEGYRDPTANQAIGNVMREERYKRRHDKVLERYDPKYDQESVISDVMKKNGCSRTQAIGYLRTKVPKESYYQTEIKKAIQKRYPDAFITKIAQGAYSQKGIPDLMVIIDGLYFGFEIKRPIFGEPSKLQIQTIKWIQNAGGTAAIVTWPEECFRVIDQRRCEHE